MNKDAAVTRLLMRVRARITDPRHWTHDRFAATAKGRTCTPYSEGADRWCVVGALHRETADDPFIDGQLYHAAVLRLREAAPLGAPAELVNDLGGHAEVLALLDEAIRQK
jgi:hypothetical protein